MERLGYGTHLTVDAYQAQQVGIATQQSMQKLLALLARTIENSCDEEFLEAVVVTDGGLSAARLCSESQLFIHLFPEAEALSFRVFTRRNATLSPLVEMLRKHFRTGRFESHISSVSKLAAHDKSEVEAMLQGDRRYALARFETMNSGR